MSLSPIAAWILTFLIHSTALFAVAFLVLKAVRGPAARVLVLRGALLGAFVTASVASFSTQGETWTLPATQGPGRIISMAPGTTAATIEQEPPALANLGERAAAKEPAATTPPFSNQAWTWLPIALSLLGVLGVIRLGLREHAAWRLLNRRERLADRKLRQAAKTLLGESRLTKNLRLSSSAHINAPMALGIREVVLPEKTLTELTEAQIEALLAHELAHLVRRDPLWLGASRLAVALAWFQPLLRLLMNRLEQETELAADDWAAQRIGGGMDLAVCLERVGSWLAESPTPAGAAAMASSGSGLVTRVERLLTESARESRRTLVTIAATTAITLGVFACTGPSVKPETTPVRELPKLSTRILPDDAEPSPGSVWVQISASDPDNQPSYQTPNGTFHTVARLTSWINDQRTNNPADEVELYCVGDATIDTVSPVIEAIRASGFTAIAIRGARPFQQERTSLSAYNPQPIDGKSSPATRVMITVTEPGHRLTYKSGGESMENIEELSKYLKQQLMDLSTSRVVLHPTQGVLNGDLVPVLDAAIAAGYSDVTFGGAQPDNGEEGPERQNKEHTGQPASGQPAGDPFSDGLVSCHTMTLTLDSQGNVTEIAMYVPTGEAGELTTYSDKKILQQLTGPNRPKVSPPLPLLLKAATQRVQILVHPDTPFTHVQQIMELCATREIQISDIHVGLTSGSSLLTDFSLPVDEGFLAEMGEGAEEEEAEEDRVTSSDKKPNLTGTTDSHLVVYIQLDVNDKSVLKTGWSSVRFSGSVDSLHGMKGVIEVNCKPDVTMGILLAWLNRYTQEGARLVFTASAFVGEDD